MTHDPNLVDSDQAIDGHSEPSLADLTQFFLKWKRWVIAGALIGAGIGFTYVWLVQPIYRAEVVVMPAASIEASGSATSAGSQLGGLGYIFGLNMQGESAVLKNLAVMRSRAFATSFVTGNQLKTILTPDDALGIGVIPRPRRQRTLHDAVKLWLSKVMQISEDKRSGLITVSIRWHDRDQAAQWANKYVSAANAALRAAAIRDAEESIKYVEQQLKATTVIEIRESLIRVLESQMKIATLARTRTDYAFQVIDPAVPPAANEPVSPRLFPVVIFSSLVGLCVALVVGLSIRRSATV